MRTGGADYRARLSANPWDPATANVLNAKDIFTTDIAAGRIQPGDPQDNPDEDPDKNAFPDIVGKRVYVRRLVDIRTVEERRYSILLNATWIGSAPTHS